MLKAILAVGPGKATAEYISLLSGKSLTSIYRSLEQLAGLGVVQKRGSTYAVAPTNPFVEAFAALADSEKIIYLDGEAYLEVMDANRALEEHLGEGGYSLVVFGSASRGTRTPLSDIDMLLVTPSVLEEAVPVSSPYLTASMTTMTETDFEAAWTRGDDLVRSAVSWGIIITDPRGMVYRYRSSVPRVEVTEESLLAARTQISALWEKYYRAGEAGSWNAADICRVRLATAIGRAFLLEMKVFPKTRPEIPGQLERVGFTFAEELESLQAPEKESSESIYRASERGLDALGSYYNELVQDRSKLGQLLTLLGGSRKEVERAFCALSAGLDAGLCCEAQDTDDLVLGNGLRIEFRSTTKGIDNRTFMNRVSGDDLLVVYLPYRRYPPDERSYVVRPEVRSEAARRKIRLLPASRLFGALSDVIARKKGAEGELARLLHP
ncbi:MAG: nucleotidyltransferase domain-containing protein [Actinomycetota bacterium]